jgi:hypothetical protein
MGEACRTTDTNLGRQVAIKVLPRPSRKTLIAWLGSSARELRNGNFLRKKKRGNPMEVH